MSESVLNDMLTPEEAVRGDVRCICFVLDDDIIEGLQRLKKIFGIPMGAMIADPLRQLINTFLPLADLYEQGKLTLGCIPEFMKGIESLVIKADVAKARLDKKVKKLEKQKTIELRSKTCFS
jgi:hypothetical protein